MACVRPMPFSQCSSISISCPGRSLAMKMSSCTGRMGLAANVSAWLALGTHSRSFEVTTALRYFFSGRISSGLACGFLVHATLSRNTTVLSSVGSSPAAGARPTMDGGPAPVMVEYLAAQRLCRTRSRKGGTYAS